MSNKNDIEPDINALNLVISTPENREGAVRAGLQLGDNLSDVINADTVKMSGKYDTLLCDELGLRHGFHTTPSRTIFRKMVNWVIDTGGNYENTIIWSEFTTPRPLGEYDVVHLHNAVPLWGFISAALRCKVAGVPYVVTTHGISKIPDLPQSMEMSATQQFVFNKAFLKPYRSVLRNASHLIALSQADSQRLQNMFPGHHVSVVPNGVNLNKTGPATYNKFDIPTEKPVILFVGKILESKGVDDLLDAYRQIESDCTLIVAGPPLNENLVSTLQQFDDSDVRYLGYADQDVLELLYRRAELFVFPTRSDVFPLVTLEALAAGTPVVSTTVGGIPEQITDETGILVPPRQPEEIAAAVSGLLEDGKRRISMGSAAMERAKSKYSWDSVARKTVRIYEQICE